MAEKETLLNILPEEIKNEINDKYNDLSFNILEDYFVQDIKLEEFVNLYNNIDKSNILIKNEIIYRSTIRLLRMNKVKKNENNLRDIKRINNELKIIISKKRKLINDEKKSIKKLINTNLNKEYNNKRVKYDRVYNSDIFDDNILSIIFSYLTHDIMYYVRSLNKSFYKAYFNSELNILINNAIKYFNLSSLIGIMSIKDKKPDDNIKDIILSIDILRFEKKENIISNEIFLDKLRRLLKNFNNKYILNIKYFYSDKNINLINTKSILCYYIKKIDNIYQIIINQNNIINNIKQDLLNCEKYNVKILFIEKIEYLLKIIDILKNNNINLLISHIILCDTDNKYLTNKDDKMKIINFLEHIKLMNYFKKIKHVILTSKINYGLNDKYNNVEKYSKLNNVTSYIYIPEIYIPEII